MPFEWSHPEFQFRSNREWEQISAEDDESRLELYCRETQTVITLSMDAYEIPADKFAAVAEQVMKARKQAHLDAIRHLLPDASEADLSYEHEHIKPHSSGHGYEVYYEGTQRGKCFFGYLAYVTNRKIFNLFVNTQLSFAAGRRGMFQEVVAGFGITLP